MCNILASLMRVLFSFCWLLVCSSSLHANEKVVLCTDSNFWFPFTFVDNSHSAGIHVDIVRAAISGLGIEVVFKPMLWNECLNSARDGLVDGVVTASYKDKRAVFLHYPKDARSKKSEFRVSQVEYVVVTHSDDKYAFKGNLGKIPEPVRVAKGYSVVSTLREHKLKIHENSTGEMRNLKKLVKIKKGSVVTTPEVFDLVKRDEVMGAKVKSSLVPIQSKSYFLAFSKASNLSQERMSDIWNQIAIVRDDSNLVATFTQKYVK